MDLLPANVIVLAGDAPLLAESLARRFSQDGASIILAGSAAGPLQELQAALYAEGKLVTIYALKTGAIQTYDNLIERILAQFRRLDVWVNLVGETPAEPAEQLSETGWRAALEDHLTPVFHGCQAAGRRMLAQGSGVIINCLPVEAFRGVEGGLAAAVLGAGVAALTRQLAIEWADRGVRVVGVALKSSAIQSRPVQPSDANEYRRIPLHRPAHPDEIAEVIVYLAGPEAAYVTGEIVPVDGGWGIYQLF